MTRARPVLAALATLLLLLLLASGVEGQRWSVGGGVAVSLPRAELDRHIDEGWGVGGQLVYRVDPAGVLGLRLDGSVVTYGRERIRTPLSHTVGRVLVDVETSNNIAVLGFGPQLTLPAGALRPYVNGAVGLGYFYTESDVRGSGNVRFDDFARTTNFDDVSFSWGGGGGVEVALSSGRHPLLLQLDAQYRNHGRTEFLREGSIEEDDAGRVTFDPLRAEADVLLLRLGVGVGL